LFPGFEALHAGIWVNAPLKASLKVGFVGGEVVGVVVWYFGVVIFVCSGLCIIIHSPQH
jgi:hypothetical protein